MHTRGAARGKIKSMTDDSNMSVKNVQVCTSYPIFEVYQEVNVISVSFRWFPNHKSDISHAKLSF